MTGEQAFVSALLKLTKVATPQNIPQNNQNQNQRQKQTQNQRKKGRKQGYVIKIISNAAFIGHSRDDKSGLYFHLKDGVRDADAEFEVGDEVEYTLVEANEVKEMMRASGKAGKATRRAIDVA